MAKKKNKKTSLDMIIEELQSPDVHQCAVVMLTKQGNLMIGSHNINEVDVIELFRKTANFMIDPTNEATVNDTIH